MILVKGDVFKSNCDYIGITTNSIVKINGELVMGAGVAKMAKELYPNLPKLFGDKILKHGCVGGYYGILKEGKFFAFQTKRHFKDNSNINDVIKSIEMLKNIAENTEEKTFALPFPAINNGGLNREDVLPYLEFLPNNVYIYEL